MTKISQTENMPLGKNSIAVYALSFRADAIVFACASVVFLLHTIHYIPTIVDDAFITFRYVENIINGNGFVFNIGERVEGCSTILFALLLSAINFPFRSHPALILETARIIGVVSGLLQLLLVLVWSRYLLKMPIHVTAVLLIALSLNTYFVYWSMNGLETSFYGLVLFGILTGFDLLQSSRTRFRSLIVFSLVLTGSLCVVTTRPEAIMYLFVYLFAAIVSFAWNRDWNSFWIWGCAGLIAVAILFACRFAFYRDLLPNTYYAKYIDPASPRVCGSKYLTTFFAASFAAILLNIITVIGVFVGLRRILFVPFLIVLGSMFFAWHSNGDWMFNFRFFAPIIPAYLLLVAYGGYSIYRALRRQFAVPALFFVSVFTIILGVYVIQVARISEWRPYFDARHWDKKTVFSRNRLGGPINPIVLWPQYLHYCRPDDWIMLPDIGLPAFVTPARVIDSQGLTDRAIAKALYSRRKKDAIAFQRWDASIMQSIRSKNPLIFDDYKLWFAGLDERSRYVTSQYGKINKRLYIRSDHKPLSYAEKKKNILYACAHAPRITAYGDLAIDFFRKSGDVDGLKSLIQIHEAYPGLDAIAQKARTISIPGIKN